MSVELIRVSRRDDVIVLVCERLISKEQARAALLEIERAGSAVLELRAA